MSVLAAAGGRRIYAAEATATATEAQAAACWLGSLGSVPVPMAAASVALFARPVPVADGRRLLARLARPLFLLPMAAACCLCSLGLFLFRSTAPPMAEAAADHNKTGGTGKKYNYCRLCLRACTYICNIGEEKKIPTNEKKII